MPISTQKKKTEQRRTKKVCFFHFNRSTAVYLLNKEENPIRFFTRLLLSLPLVARKEKKEKQPLSFWRRQWLQLIKLNAHLLVLLRTLPKFFVFLAFNFKKSKNRLVQQYLQLNNAILTHIISIDRSKNFFKTFLNSGTCVQVYKSNHLNSASHSKFSPLESDKEVHLLVKCCLVQGFVTSLILLSEMVRSL